MFSRFLNSLAHWKLKPVIVYVNSEVLEGGNKWDMFESSDVVVVVDGCVCPIY